VVSMTDCDAVKHIIGILGSERAANLATKSEEERDAEINAAITDPMLRTLYDKFREQHDTVFVALAKSAIAMSGVI